jgi:hypothetical protein
MEHGEHMNGKYQEKLDENNFNCSPDDTAQISLSFNHIDNC